MDQDRVSTFNESTKEGMESVDEFSNLRCINNLMQHHSGSSSTSIIFTALPSVARGDQADAQSYVDKLDVLSADLPPVVMVYGSSPVMANSII